MSMPTLVPATDRAPSLASRIVTIHATDVTEGAPAPDSFTFSLPCALRVPADDVILRPGGVKVRLVDGRAQVRLPVYSAAVQTVDGSTDWVVIVKPSWGDPYPIRVPAGTSAISLADLPSVRPLTRREQQYAITSVGVTVTEGTQAGGSASYTNGNLDLKIQVPAFRPQTVYPYIDQTADARAKHYEARVLENLDKRLEEVTTAYELAVVQGFDGTLDEWLDSLIGPGNVLSVDQVDTGAPGSDAAVTISGKSPKQALSFTIPRGDRGATGPANALTVGEVVTGKPGSDAAVTISGKSPAQKVAFTIPRGDKGDKGDASTVPGPTGKTAYQYAKEAGFTGTEDEFAQAQLPDTIGWGNIEGKPSTFPPASHSHAWSTITGKPTTFTPTAHTHAQEEIDGLVAKLEALTNAATDSGWVEFPLHEGFTQQGNYPLRARRIGPVVYLSGGISGTGLTASAAYTVADIPAGFRPGKTVYTMGGSNSADTSPLIIAFSNGSLELRTNSTSPNYCLVDGLSYLVD